MECTCQGRRHRFRLPWPMSIAPPSRSCRRRRRKWRFASPTPGHAKGPWRIATSIARSFHRRWEICGSRYRAVTIALQNESSCPRHPSRRRGGQGISYAENRSALTSRRARGDDQSAAGRADAHAYGEGECPFVPKYAKGEGRWSARAVRPYAHLVEAERRHPGPPCRMRYGMMERAGGGRTGIWDETVSLLRWFVTARVHQSVYCQSTPSFMATRPGARTTDGIHSN